MQGPTREGRADSSHSSPGQSSVYIKGLPRVLVLGSLIVVPVAIGVLSDSVLLGVVAFAVWTTVALTGARIRFSSRNVETLPPSRAANQSLENGWVLPLRVRVRESAYPDLEASIDRNRAIAAYFGLGMCIPAIVVPFAFGHPSHGDPAVLVGILAVNVLLVNVFIVAYCRRSLRHRMPRPNLDRPSSLLFAAVPLLLALVYLIAGVARIGGWNSADAVGLITLGLSIAANFWWAFETARRWNLAYEVVKS
jgi:NADH:ubiquinone oxidoreductase subunit 6 (subunit J)